MQRYMVIGLGAFGRTLAMELARLGAEVLAIDRDPALVGRVAPYVALAVTADATDPQVLDSQNAKQMDCAIVATGEQFEVTVLTTTLLVELGVPLVMARAMSQTQKQILKKVGAHAVVMPEYEIAERLARSLHLSGVVDFVELPEGYCLKQVRVPKDFVGQSLQELSMRQKERVMVIRIRRKRLERDAGGEPHLEDELIAIPDGAIELRDGDVLSVIGSETAVARLGTEE